MEQVWTWSKVPVEDVVQFLRIPCPSCGSALGAICFHGLDIGHTWVHKSRFDLLIGKVVDRLEGKP